MKKCVIYARYSSDSQTEQSIEGQLRVCEDYAKNNHIQILNRYIDRAMTGTNDNRPDFRNMLRDAEAKEWDIVLVYRFDRFSRNKYESVIHKKYLKDLGIKVVSAMENIPDTPEGIILESLLEGMNQYYSAELSLKVKRGLRESRLKGNFTGGCVPFGYYIKDHKLVINEDEAKAIRLIFQLYSQDVIGTHIVKILNRRKITYRGRLFEPKFIYKILAREYYTGLYEFNGEYYQNLYPQIISRNLYAKVKQISIDNMFGVSGKEIYTLKKMMFCKHCGGVFVCDSSTKGNKTQRYYKCIGRREYKNCNSLSFNKHQIEEFIKNYLTSFISNEANLKLLIISLMKKLKKRLKNKFLDSLILEKKNNEIVLDNYMKALEAGLYTDKLKKNIDEVEVKIKKIDQTIISEKYRDVPKLSKAFIKKYYINALKYKLRAFSRALIIKILVDEKSIDIYLENPYCDRYDNFTLLKTEKVSFEKFLNRKDDLWDGNVSVFV